MTIRAMRPDDVPRGLALCRASGWNQVPADWEQLLVMGAERSWVAEADGRVVGTVTVVLYEGRFAWIGMVLVEPAMRGQGIGRALMDRALAAIGDVPARLDATPAGYPLYCRLGFVAESRVCRMTREPSGAPDAAGGTRRTPPALRPLTAGDLAAVRSWDRAVFGADRGDLLEWAFATTPSLAWVMTGETGLHGYCLGRPGYSWTQVGPVVAADPGVGAALVSACVAASGSVPLVVDSAAGAHGWTAALAALGFAEQRQFVRMCRGRNRHAGRCAEQLAIFGPEWG